MTEQPHSVIPINTAEPLLVRHQHGDPAAFAELVSHHWKSVHNYLFRCGIDRATREDLLQEIFTKVHQNADAYRPDRPLRVWIYTIAANTARSHFRKQTAKSAAATQIDIAPEILGDPAADHREVAEANQTLDCLAKALHQLPVSQRQVIVLCCVEGLSQQEVAEILEVPQNTIKTHLRRARFALARALARRELTGAREVGE